MSETTYGYDEVMKAIANKEPDVKSHLDDVMAITIGFKCQCGKYVRMSVGNIMEELMSRLESDDFDLVMRQFQ
jgi:hypothetical protein